MIRIFKYLKSSFISIIVIVGLLILQASLDLKLPDYTSKIVNVGIQQKGVEDAASLVISKETMKNISYFLTEEEKEIINDCYKLNKVGKTDYKLNKKEEIYTLIEDNRKKASEILLEPFMILYTLENMDNEDLKVKDGVSPLHFLPLLSEKDKKEILNKLDKIPDSTKMQTAILSVLNEYEKVGIDIY